MDELWSSIGNGFSISSKGRLRNDRTNRILKEYKDKRGRPRVRVKLSNGRNISITREVYKAFINKDLRDNDRVFRIDVNKPASVDNIKLYNDIRSNKYEIGSIIHDKYKILGYEKTIKSCSLRRVYILKCNVCNCICLCDVANIDTTKKHRCLCNTKKTNLLV